MPLAELADQTAGSATSLVADAYRTLKDAICNNVFAPGYQGSEQEIALRLGMSRTPVHEALIRLQEEGLVRVLPKRGVVVCALSPQDMGEIYDVIIALEARAAELLAGMANADRQRAFAALDGINREMAAALKADDLNAWALADNRFHRALFEHCGNGRLARAAATIMDQSHRGRMLTLRLRARPTQSMKEHQSIAVAVRSGNAAKAAARARSHRQRARDELLPLLDQLGMKHL